MTLRRLHSCRRTRDHITDLVFSEKQEPQRSSLLAEVESCPDCFAHYRSLADTLSLFDEAICLAEPGGKAFEEYQERLENKVFAVSDRKWHLRLGRTLRSNIRIPVPIAAGFVIACLAAIAVMAFRPAQVKLVEIPGSTKTVDRVVEVPVVTEKVVTKTVYLSRKDQTSTATQVATENASQPTTQTAVPAATPDQTQRVAETEPLDNGGSITRANLSGFQPSNELKMRVIRKGEDAQK